MLNIFVSIASFIKKQCIRKLIKELEGLQSNINNSSKTIKIYLLHPWESHVIVNKRLHKLWSNVVSENEKSQVFQQGQFNRAFSSHNMFKKKRSMVFILLILWFNKSGDFAMYRMTSANQKSSPQSKKRLCLTSVIDWFCW